MPKINLYPTWTKRGERPADNRIELGWQDGGVQIATTKLQPGADPDREFVDGPDGQPQPAWEGQFVELTRDRINHLIQVLREARDKAYGRDQ